METRSVFRERQHRGQVAAAADPGHCVTARADFQDAHIHMRNGGVGIVTMTNERHAAGSKGFARIFALDGWVFFAPNDAHIYGGFFDVFAAEQADDAAAAVARTGRSGFLGPWSHGELRV